MEKVLNLSEEKRDAIIDVSMSLFGAVGYKKASVADIAAAAGIGKAMVFYYFGSKKALYLYLIEVAAKTLTDTIDSGLDPNVTDFFDKIQMATEIKMSVLRKYPGILSFLTSMYKETDKEVEREIKQILSEGESFASAFVIDHADTHKFKEDVDPQLVFEILINYSEGYISKKEMRTQEDMDTMLSHFYNCLELLRKHLYKEEYC